MPSMTTPRKRTGENLNVWIRSTLVEQIRAFIDTTRPRTTKTAIVEEALEAFLAITPELRAALHSAAAAQQCSIAEIIVSYLERGLSADRRLPDPPE